MANASPTEFSARPKGWYAPTPDQPGLKPVDLKKPTNPTVMERKACKCGESFMLTDVEPEVTCGCGEVVKL